MGLALVHQPGIVTFLFACPKRKVTKRKKVPSTREQSQRPAGIALLFNRGPSIFLWHRAVLPVKKKALPPYVGNIPFGRACLADGGGQSKGFVNSQAIYSVGSPKTLKFSYS
jgi:hypothetical protein